MERGAGGLVEAVPVLGEDANPIEALSKEAEVALHAAAGLRGGNHGLGVSPSTSAVLEKKSGCCDLVLVAHHAELPVFGEDGIPLVELRVEPSGVYNRYSLLGVDDGDAASMAALIAAAVEAGLPLDAAADHGGAHVVVPSASAGVLLHLHYGALPVFAEDGTPLVALCFKHGGQANRYRLLDADGLDDGDAALLAALLRGEGGDRGEIRVAELLDLGTADGEAVLHAADDQGAVDVAIAGGQEVHGHAHNDNTVAAVAAEGRAPALEVLLRGGSGLLRAARRVVFFAAAGAYSLMVVIGRSPSFAVLRAMVPCMEELAHALAAAAALLGNLVERHQGIAHEEEGIAHEEGIDIHHADEDDAAADLQGEQAVAAEEAAQPQQPRGARLIVYATAASAFHLIVFICTSPVFIMLSAFLPGIEELLYAAAGAAALVAMLALQG